MVWYSHLFKNLPQFVVIHTVKGLIIINEAEVDVSLEFSCFYYYPKDIGNLCFYKFSIFNLSGFLINESPRFVFTSAL